MTATSPGFNLSKPNDCDIEASYLQDNKIIHSLSRFFDILSSCFGPNGKFKMLQNKSGGHLAVTSSSGRLLHLLSVKSPVLKLIMSSMQCHLSLYSDGGLYIGITASSIILKSLDSEINPVLVSEILDLLSQKIRDIVLQPTNEFDIDIDLEISHLKRIIIPVISSKQLWISRKSDVDYICKLLLLSFVNCFPSSEFSDMRYKSAVIVTKEGYHVQMSQFIPGILVSATHNLRPIITPVKRVNGMIRTVLSNISFSGDSDEFIDFKYELSLDISGNDVVLQRIMKLCDKFLSDDVGIVLSQKVLHPNIKEYLHKSHILVIDRLGRSAADMVEKLSGAIPINNLHEKELQECYGHIDDIKILSLCDTYYYHITRSNSFINTLYLSSKTEEALSELKHVCDAANHTLRMAVNKPKAVPGSGCFELIIAGSIKQKAKEVEEVLSNDLECSTLQIKAVVDILVNVLHKIAQLNSGIGKTFSNSKHLWSKSSLTCNCGYFTCSDRAELTDISNKTSPGNLMKNDYKFIDLKEPKVNALLTGISTAALVLRTGTFIHEKM